MGAVEAYLRYAREDLADAEARLGDDRPVWRKVALHAQQVAEKVLKALIFRLGADPVRTHDLTALRVDVGVLNAALGRRLSLRYRAVLAEMTGYAVSARDPGRAQVDESQARAALAAAGALFDDLSPWLAAD